MLNTSRSSDAKKGLGLDAEKISELYRPLKRPVTLRLDADVLAWFKREGKRYQTRINQALRQLMEREMKQAR
ncbi:MAG TPA: BrnA antitoxin family protein [Candidatus Sulfotelmatobacter sp.]|nr:BrnA antitoxin family protein [Candidatus Sulfotelmatobacter sp.]